MQPGVSSCVWAAMGFDVNALNQRQKQAVSDIENEAYGQALGNKPALQYHSQKAVNRQSKGGARQ